MSYAIIKKSCTGASHIRVNKECQDNLDSREFKKEQTVIMAVADGHGSNSCPYSEDGSDLAVKTFINIIGNLFKNYIDNPRLLMTYLNREGDTKVAQEICQEWQKRVIERHSLQKREIPFNEDGDIDKEVIWKQYGTTLLGLLVCDDFLFAFQIGDGDIAFVNKNGFSKVIEGDKILGVETHSLSKADAWKRAITSITAWDYKTELPSAFIMTTDGFANSFSSDSAYEKTCVDYYDMLNEYGPEVIKNNLKKWLYETSEGGCGDDISMMILYFYHDDAVFKPVPKDEA